MLCESCKTEMGKVKINYHYRESGLQNVIIEGILAYKCPNCNKFYPIIPNVKKLHELIAQYLVNKQSPLSGKELIFLRKQLGFKAKDFADMLGVTKVTVSRWENKDGPIGVGCDRFIRVLYTNRLLRSKCEIAMPEITRLKSEIKETSLIEDFIALCDWIGKTDISLKDIKKRYIKSRISIPASTPLGPLFIDMK